MDETPFFWEYLPRRVATRKLSKTTKGWKRGYDHSRSTLTLAITAAGTFLRPCLVLKRKSAYELQATNDIGLWLTHTANGWMSSETTIGWLKEILIPYVNSRQCLLMFDSYQGHINDSVFNFLQKYPNIHLGVIVGGTTARDQPLDIKVNKAFKDECRKRAIRLTNNLLEAVFQSGEMKNHESSSINKKLVKGIFFVN